MGLEFSELMVILVIILILFGPGNLPNLGRALGRSVRDFRDVQREIVAPHETDEQKQVS